MAVFDTSGVNNMIQMERSCLMPNYERRACGPQENASCESCTRLGCCYNPVPWGDGVPQCFHNRGEYTVLPQGWVYCSTTGVSTLFHHRGEYTVPPQGEYTNSGAAMTQCHEGMTYHNASTTGVSTLFHHKDEYTVPPQGLVHCAIRGESMLFHHMGEYIVPPEGWVHYSTTGVSILFYHRGEYTVLLDLLLLWPSAMRGWCTTMLLPQGWVHCSTTGMGTLFYCTGLGCCYDPVPRGHDVPQCFHHRGEYTVPPQGWIYYSNTGVSTLFHFRDECTVPSWRWVHCSITGVRTLFCLEWSYCSLKGWVH